MREHHALSGTSDRHASILGVNKRQDVRIFTDWNNPFGGRSNSDICNTLVSGTLEGPLEGGM